MQAEKSRFTEEANRQAKVRLALQDRITSLLKWGPLSEVYYLYQIYMEDFGGYDAYFTEEELSIIKREVKDEQITNR